jgi:uncharacterized protein YukE
MGFTVPPQADFTNFSNLVLKQGDHFGSLGSWAGGNCSNSDGLDGLLEPLRGIVHEIGSHFDAKYGQCQKGMPSVSGKVLQAREAYRHSDRGAQDALKKTYPNPLPGFHEPPNLPVIGNFDDTDIELKQPTSAEEDTQNSIEHTLDVVSKKLIFGELKGAENVFKFLTGHSLVELLITPLVGKYGRLKFLQNCFEEASEASYTVAGNLRKSSWRMAAEWTGDAADAFDSYMFRWHMGIGGLGDAAKVVANVYRDGFAAVTALVWTALTEINKLMEQGVKKLAEEAAKIAAGDAAIEAVGLGPEDPLADIGAGIYSAWRLYELYKDVKLIIGIINGIHKTFDAISKAVKAISDGVDAVKDFFSSPTPSVDDLKKDMEQRGAEFEKAGFWNPKLGALRIGLLPSS